MPGWAMSVRWTRSPFVQQASESEKPSHKSASSNVARASGKRCAKSRPMPGNCAPWPGNRIACAGLIGSPADQRPAPGQAGPEGGQDHELAGPGPAGAHGLVERHGHRGSRGVGVVLDVDHELVPVPAPALERRVDDPQVDLVRHDEADLVLRVALRELLDQRTHALDREAVDLATLDADVVLAAVDARVRRRVQRSAADHVDQLVALAIRPQCRPQELALLALLPGREHDGPRAVAPKEARTSV